MADPSGRIPPTAGASNELDSLVDKYPRDAGAHPPDEDSSISARSDQDTAGGSKTKLAGLAASLRLFSESMLRTDRAEMEMARAREASRLEAEKRRAELDAELTRMMAQTQLQIAAIVAGKGDRSRKRKRVGESEDQEDRSFTVAGREGAMLLNLLQCNMFL